MKVSWARQHKPWEAAASEDFRHVLEGVYIDPEGWLVATNGFVMAIAPCTLEETPENFEDFQGAIVPVSIMEAASAYVPHQMLHMQPSIVIDGNDVETIVAVSPLIKMTAITIHGKYPDWRGRIPNMDKLEPVKWLNFDPGLLSKAVAALGDVRYLHLLGTETRTSNPSPILVLANFNDGGERRAFALLMPQILPEQALDEALLRINALREG